MANKLLLKRSSVALKVPLATDLDVGELAVNLTDQKLYSKKSDGTVILVGSGLGGAGDVQGPASSTDNAIARYDGTTGKTIQNSAATISDTGTLLLSTSSQYNGYRLSNGTYTVAQLIGFSATNDEGGLTLQAAGNAKVQLLAAGPSYFAGGNVGFGLSNPAFPVHIANLSGNSETIVAQYGTGTRALIGAYANEMSLRAYNGTNDFMTFYTGGSERVRIRHDGAFMVGTTAIAGQGVYGFSLATNGQRMTISSNGANSSLDFYRNADGVIQHFVNLGNITGYIFNTSTGTQYVTTSDYRLKEDVAPMQNALEKVARLKPCTYKWKSNGKVSEGFIAHELQDVCPEAVTGTKDAVGADGKPMYQGVDTSFLVATLTAAIQELKQELDAVKAELNQLKGT